MQALLCGDARLYDESNEGRGNVAEEDVEVCRLDLDTSNVRTMVFSFDAGIDGMQCLDVAIELRRAHALFAARSDERRFRVLCVVVL